MSRGKITYNEKVCPTCGDKFTTSFKMKRGSTFCSKKCSKISENNPQWKGNKVKYGGLHRWVEAKLGRPEACSCCGKVGLVDLANISGRYKRDLFDWEWLCRKCHMNKDGRLAIFLSHSPNKKLENKNCAHCEKSFHPANKTVNFCSLSCSTTFNNLKRGKNNKLKLNF